MKIKYHIPQRWNDLNQRQIMRIGQIMAKSEKMPRWMLVSLILSILLMPKRGFWRFIKNMYLFSRVPLSELQTYCDFILKRTDVLTTFPREIKVGDTILYGPSDRLANLTIEEFSYADAFFFAWVANQSSVDLDRLVAVLYRRKAVVENESDQRMPFDKLTLSLNASFTSDMPSGYKQVIGLAFQGSREKIYARYPVVFPVSKPKKEEEKTKADDKPMKYVALNKIIQSMAMDETQTLGTMQEAEKVNISTFFDIYQESIIRAREREKMLN